MKTGSDFISSYLSWLKQGMQFSNIGEYTEITTPFLDNNNDHIQIYIKQQDNNQYLLTDDGITIAELEMSGCDLSTSKRKQILSFLVNRVGVNIQDSELIVSANEYNFPQKKHSLIQAILSVNDMFMLAQSKVKSLFLEDVEEYLSLNDIRFTPTIQFLGESGLSHTFDFVIPSSRSMPERLIRTLNDPNKERTESILFSWNDTREMRSKNSLMYVFINDIDKHVKSDIPSAFFQYGVKPILWSKRGDALQELTA